MKSYVIKFPSERRRADLAVFLASYANEYGTTDDHGEHGDAVANAVPLDLDALRLVLDAANCHRETMDERANDPRTLEDKEAREECDKLADAIAKIESLLR